MSKKPKMAFIDVSNFSDWPIGGMLEYELSILKHLIKYYDIDLWGVSVNGKKPSPIYINNQLFEVHVYANVSTNRKIIPNFWRGMGLLNNAKFKKTHYDVIYGHSGSCMVAAALSVCKKKTVLAYHQHGLSYLTNYSLMSMTQKPFYYFAQKMSDIVFLVTDPDSAKNFAMKMKNKSRAEFICIGSPINIEDFDYKIINNRLQERKDKKIQNLIYVGRLSPEKNVVDMLYALHYYIKKTGNNNIVLKLVGDGTDRINIEKAITRLSIKKNVILYGSIPHKDVYKHLMDSDAFLISSNGEGVSIAVLEAFATGLPVICYKVPGLEKQNIDGVTGIIVKDKNPYSFANGIMLMEKTKNEMALNCIAESKKYDSRFIVDNIIQSIRNKKIGDKNE